MDNTAILLFPPNWSACVSGPHLALPLLAGASQNLPNWHIESWDLSNEFYTLNSTLPNISSVQRDSLIGDYHSLDNIYFTWEDELRNRFLSGNFGEKFSLLSGFSFGELDYVNHLHDVSNLLKASGSIYKMYFENTVIPSINARNPRIIGISISSWNQIVPSIELLQLIRHYIPDVVIALGGNIVTRLRKSSALNVFSKLADKLIIFQGEIIFSHILKSIDQISDLHTNFAATIIDGDESIPYSDWPIPLFSGFQLDRYAGITALPYVSTRGCYWGRCHFCAIPAAWSKKGFAGSAPASFVVEQIVQMVEQTSIVRIKFVDESLSPGKAAQIAKCIAQIGLSIEWEAYARLEPVWENESLLDLLYLNGLRKLYFGLEQAPSTNRDILGKCDSNDPIRIFRACHRAGIKTHVFCMVGHPRTSRADAYSTIQFLLDNNSLIDTADLVGFRLDRGTTVPGVRPLIEDAPDWSISLPFEPLEEGVMCANEIEELEFQCQEIIWNQAPRLLHPLYRLIGPWQDQYFHSQIPICKNEKIIPCSVNS